MTKANPERGEVPLTVTRDGQVIEFVLFLSTTHTMQLQRRKMKPFGTLLEEIDKLDVETIRDVLFALLQKNHAAEFKTTEAVSDLIDEFGGPMKAYKKIIELLKLNAPEDADANPTGAPTPIGDGSSSTPGV